MSDDALDREFLDELLDGDKEFAQELFDTYFDSADTAFAEAQRMLNSGDAQNVFRPFHTLKGASASVGLLHLQGLARDFELKAKAGELEACQGGMDELSQSITEAKALLTAYLEGL